VDTISNNTSCVQPAQFGTPERRLVYAWENEVAELREATVADNFGTVIKVERVEDNAGQTVLRVTVDFYDGASPDLTFKTVWQMTPVRIIEATKTK
jgi:hypothetical protein